MASGDLKKLSQQFSLTQIEQCIDQQIAKGTNACTPSAAEGDAVLEVLSKATVVRELMDKGMTFPEALRELGKRIRSVYSSESPEE